MSELEFIHELRKLKRQMLKSVIVAIISGLILMIIGGGLTMAKVFNVKGKADKEYVDRFYGDVFRVVEDRILLLEARLKAEEEGRTKDIESIDKKLDKLEENWRLHYQYHMDEERGFKPTSK